MKLKDFVSTTLLEVFEGVSVAAEASKKFGGKVNPVRVVQGTMRPAELKYPVLDIEFDVAITTNEGTETKGGLGVFVGPIGVGSSGKSNESAQSVSRIKFTVPVMLPYDDLRKNQ